MLPVRVKHAPQGQAAKTACPTVVLTLECGMSTLQFLCVLLAVAAAAFGQTPDNKTLTGKYFVRELLIGTDPSGNLNDARSLLGTMTFNAAGQYAFTGQQTIAAGAPTALTSNGTYSVAPNDSVTLTDPLRTTLSLNARYGVEALIGSSTETSDNAFTLFIAIPAPIATQSNSSLNGTYTVATLEFPGGSAASAKNTFFTLQPNGAGAVGSVRVVGHAANASNGLMATQTIASATYSVTSDGSGMALFGNTASLLTGTKNIYVSRTGNVILGGSLMAGAQDLLIGIRSVAAGASNASWHDQFWTAGLRLDSSGTTASYAGALSAIPSLGKLTLTRRVHQAGFGGAYDFTGTNSFNIAANGTGTEELSSVGLGGGGDLFISSEVNASDTSGYEINFGIRTPALSGTGLFLNPNGIVNGASLAPAGNPIAPGEFITLYSTNIGPAASVAAKPPYPKTLGGVTVTVNGTAAPLHFVGPGQINLLVPYATAGTKATIVVSNNGNTSNSVDVALAPTAPGVFSLDQSGTGPGAVLHADFTLVNDASPARRGETILIYLTGLGAVTPGVADGTAAGSNPLSAATANVSVRVGGAPATIVFAGLAPGFPGLYQINATVPLATPASGRLPLAIVAPNAFHDQVDLPVE